MKKQMIITLALMILIVSCGSDGDTETSSNGKYTATFIDSSVTSFLQTSNIAHMKPSSGKKILNFVIPMAYAAGGQGEISCFEGDTVDFDITTTIGSATNMNSVTTTCSTGIELSIRRGLLEGLKDVAIYRTTTEAAYTKGLLNFRSSAPNAGPYGSGFAWDLQYQVKTINTPSACFDLYTFTESTGTVEVKPDFATNAGAGGNCLCDDANEGDSSHPSYNSDCRTVTASFRFIGGAMELDLTGAANFDSSLTTFERWENCSSILDASTCN